MKTWEWDGDFFFSKARFLILFTYITYLYSILCLNIKYYGDNTVFVFRWNSGSWDWIPTCKFSISFLFSNRSSWIRKTEFLFYFLFFLNKLELGFFKFKKKKI